MVQRAQPGAQRTTARNIEYGEITGQLTDGWVVPADEPTKSALRFDALNEGAFNEFNALFGPGSLTVTIEPGEAFVDGWLATDENFDVSLLADTDGQEIAIGWDPDAIYDSEIHSYRDEADKVVVDTVDNFSDEDPYFVIWSFDTDSAGVDNDYDHRKIGPSAGTVSFESVIAEILIKNAVYATTSDLPATAEGGSQVYVAEDNEIVVFNDDTDEWDAVVEGAISIDEKASADGVATLDSEGLLSSEQVPDLTVTDVVVVAGSTERLALTDSDVQTGDVVVEQDNNQSYIFSGGDRSLEDNWQILQSPPAPVSSVFGRDGAITAESGDYSHNQIDGVGEDQHHAKDHSHDEADVSSVPNSGLENSSVTVVAQDNVSGGGVVDLGGTVTVGVDQGAGSGLDADTVQGNAPEDLAADRAAIEEIAVGYYITQ